MMTRQKALFTEAAKLDKCSLQPALCQTSTVTPSAVASWHYLMTELNRIITKEFTLTKCIKQHLSHHRDVYVQRACACARAHCEMWFPIVSRWL